MTSKEQALYALMEERGLSYGCIVTTIHMIGHSTWLMDEAIDYLYENRPTEQEFIDYLAELGE